MRLTKVTFQPYMGSTLPKQSLITIEVRDNRIVQALRRFNNPVTDEDQEAINYFNRKFEKEKIAA